MTLLDMATLYSPHRMQTDSGAHPAS